MNKSNSDIKKGIMISISEEMREFGFKKRADSFYRETEKDLYQIIDFSLGPSWSIMENHLGLGFGVATEEWIKYLNNWKRPKQITTTDCEIRDNYLAFYNNNDCGWFKIINNLEKLENQIIEEIKNIIIPFLNSVKTRLDIIRLWDNDYESVGLPPRRFLSIGILMYLNGEREKGEKILRDEYEKNKDNSFYIETIKNVLNE